MMIRTIVAAAFAVSAFAAVPAFAQLNDSTTVQTGGGVNTSSTDQRGTANRATTAQFGDDNLGTIEQRGSVANKAECGQDGNINDCRVKQRDRNGN